MIEVAVDLGDRSYPVLVGKGVRSELSAVIPNGVRRVAVITQPGIGVEVDPGLPVEHFEIPDGEAAKDLTTIGSLCSSMAQSGFTRNDLVVGVGGGVVTDIAGFTAAVYHRGIRFVTVPTTLLGQIDAAIGGKTGVNLPEGKNLVGAFWQPSAVLCDTETLETLPPREYRSGMGELAKYNFLGGGALHELPLDERVAASVKIKADIVAADEREGGKRALLNYGHTLAHALETAGTYDMRHGEAVAVGLIYAAEVAHLLGRIDADRVAEHYRVLEAYELSNSLPENADHEQLLDLFSRDKKALDGVTFVLDGPSGPEVVVGVDRGVLAEALEKMP